MIPNPRDALFRGFYFRYHVEPGIRPANLSRNAIRIAEPLDSNPYCHFYGYFGPNLDSELDNGEGSLLESDPSFIRQPPVQLIISIQVSGMWLSLHKLAEFFLDMPMHGAYDLGISKGNLFWIQCSAERDYIYFLSKISYDFLNGCLNFSKWSPEFQPTHCPLIPVKFIISRLLPEYQSMANIFKIANLLGRLLQVDFGIDFSAPITDVFLTVEVDVTKDKHRQSWIYGLNCDHLTVDVHADGWFDYCKSCHVVGHSDRSCQASQQLLEVSSEDSDGC